ncbi:single-stranded DNA-binding protein [bacterium]|nr:single-stranded DNA-binding protein [bacterium]
MVNKVILVGHLGKDPEVKYLDQNRAVANVTMATNERYTDRNGNKVEQTEWHNLEMWDGLAKVAEQYLKKGALVYIEGKIKTEEWEKEGVKQRTTRIRVNTMNMLDRASDGNSSNRPASNQQQNTGNEAASNEEAINSLMDDSGEDDLPF